MSQNALFDDSANQSEQYILLNTECTNKSTIINSTIIKLAYFFLFNIHKWYMINIFKDWHTVIFNSVLVPSVS